MSTQPKPGEVLIQSPLNSQLIACGNRGPVGNPTTISVELCDHDWQKVDDSFDHEFGTEIIHYLRCAKCEATRCSDPPSPEDDR